MLQRGTMTSATAGRPPKGGRRRNTGTTGFTLVELAIVLFMLTLVFGIVVPYVGERTEINLLSQSRSLSGAMRFASGEAVFRRRPTRLYVDFAQGRYWVAIWGEDGFAPMTTPLGKARPLLDSVYFQSLWVEGSNYNKGTAFFQFDPDGGIEEAVLTIANDTGDEIAIVPDPNTGSAEVYRGGADPRVLFPAHAQVRAAAPRRSR